MAKEAAVLRRITRRLDSTPGLWYMKVHGDSHMRRGIPDLIGTYCGRGFGLEVKGTNGNTATASQKHELQKLANAGALVAVVDDVADVIELLDLQC